MQQTFNNLYFLSTNNGTELIQIPSGSSKQSVYYVYHVTYSSETLFLDRVL